MGKPNLLKTDKFDLSNFLVKGDSFSTILEQYEKNLNTLKILSTTPPDQDDFEIDEKISGLLDEQDILLSKATQLSICCDEDAKIALKLWAMEELEVGNIEPSHSLALKVKAYLDKPPSI